MAGGKRKGKSESREDILQCLQSQLAEHFDAGTGMVCWEEGGETQYLTLRFGNSFAVEAMSDQLRGCLESEAEVEEEEDSSD
jgi:hypothetical protein